MADDVKAETIDVAGGWGYEGVTFTLGINSGSAGIGFGISDQRFAIMNGRAQTTSLHLSLTPENAEEIARGLLAHAAAVRDRVASWEEPDIGAHLRPDEHEEQALLDGKSEVNHDLGA